MSIFNDKSHTYLHPASGTYTAIDLSLCSPSIYLDFKWKVGVDPMGSDHFPVFLENNGPNVLSRCPRWNLHKANWDKFSLLCEDSITPNIFENNNDVELFTRLLCKAAEESIPKTSTVPKKQSKPWFDDKCKQALSDRRSALRRFNLRPTPENLGLFRIARARAKRQVLESKRSSWKQYVSKLNSRTSIKKTWDMVRKINGKTTLSSIQHRH